VEPLKTFFCIALVKRLASDITSVHPAFPGRAFAKGACRGLNGIELLDRRSPHSPCTRRPSTTVVSRGGRDPHSVARGPEHGTGELVGVGMAPFFKARGFDSPGYRESRGWMRIRHVLELLKTRCSSGIVRRLRRVVLLF
jgi:hypothetical protein